MHLIDMTYAVPTAQIPSQRIGGASFNSAFVTAAVLLAATSFDNHCGASRLFAHASSSMRLAVAYRFMRRRRWI